VGIVLIEEILDTANLQLTSDDLRAIDAAASKIAVQGARYPEPRETNGALRSLFQTGRAGKPYRSLG
jgi:hypothetical protein